MAQGTRLVWPLSNLITARRGRACCARPRSAARRARPPACRGNAGLDELPDRCRCRGASSAGQPAAAPSTSVTSPRTGSTNRSASSETVPRTTSSWRFVSSRHTAHGRSGTTRARAASERGSRCGDSNATTGHGQPASSSPSSASARSPAGQVAEELVALPDEAARDQRRLDRRRAGQHRHRHARLERRGDQARARIVDPRQARVADERHPLAGLQPRQQLGRPLRLVVLVVGEQPRPDLMPLQQAARVARVLGEHHVRLGELAAARAA